MNDAIEEYIKDIKKNIYHLVSSDEYLEDLRQKTLFDSASFSSRDAETNPYI